MEIVWLDSAVDDLVRLRQFVEVHNPKAAKTIAAKLLETAKLLATTPNIGKPIQDLLEYRDLKVRFGAAGYVMRYRIYEDTLYIIYIKHYPISALSASLLI